MSTTAKLRTHKVSPNENISFPIGTLEVVGKYYSKLGLSRVFSKYKSRGIDINALIRGLTSYKLSENFSICRAGRWLNRHEILELLGIQPFEQRTLYRALEIIGANIEEIIFDIQNNLFNCYEFEHTDVVMDWSSLILYGEKCPIGKYGFSRDHRPDKQQITFGLSQLGAPINVPIGMTVNPGNTPDVSHFADTYEQISRLLTKGSMVVFDKGPYSKENLGLIKADKMKYLTGKKINLSDERKIVNFDVSQAELVDPVQRVWGLKFSYPSKTNYLYFSETLRDRQIQTKARRAVKKLQEAHAIQNSIECNKPLPRRFQINNPLVDVKYSYQTKLVKYSDDEALDLLIKHQITGREGFFIITGNVDLTLVEALATCRKKDSIEKIIHSMKNEIGIKPLRVRDEWSIYGALIIGFLAQLFISLIRYEKEDLRHTSTKFIKSSLLSLTVTVYNRKDGRRRYIYSNFDPINRCVFGLDQAVA